MLQLAVKEIKDFGFRKNRIYDYYLEKLDIAKKLTERIQNEAFITVNLAGINNWIEAMKKYPPLSY